MFVDIEAGMRYSQIVENLIEDWFLMFFNEGIPSIFLQRGSMRFGSSDANEVYIFQLKANTSSSSPELYEWKKLF